jgi:hypothetical protein
MHHIILIPLKQEPFAHPVRAGHGPEVFEGRELSSVFAEPLSDLIAVSQGFIKDHINHQSRRL